MESFGDAFLDLAKEIKDTSTPADLIHIFKKAIPDAICLEVNKKAPSTLKEAVEAASIAAETLEGRGGNRKRHAQTGGSRPNGKHQEGVRVKCSQTAAAVRKKAMGPSGLQRPVYDGQGGPPVSAGGGEGQSWVWMPVGWTRPPRSSPPNAQRGRPQGGQRGHTWNSRVAGIQTAGQDGDQVTGEREEEFWFLDNELSMNIEEEQPTDSYVYDQANMIGATSADGKVKIIRFQGTIKGIHSSESALRLWGGGDISVCPICLRQRSSHQEDVKFASVQGGH
uniref:Uncharacterized protein n=1 Tax=Chromera velia CCMP2878 TaxID=1169474 RepID=A0A0G4G6M7_9ALVE|eukprot:Cvel_4251.t1-p1 / transcript=Cvel_4251.t1 / gene=Cvel_4251 / organism=Chromera_velia_CCMP2878 / gene_product=hypothetical protein / transcript_product=hypothetical protein / location=Cvel_scaffold184:37394-38388(-) / protein_length=279 / sequence_SO=supercontig / SO=protein_coding / is_pseudo=false